MPPDTAPTFGKRRPQGPPARSEVLAPSQKGTWKVSLSPLEPEPHVKSVLKVPNSIGAGILTGTVLGVADLVFRFHDKVGAGTPRVPITFDGQTVDTLPLLLLGGLWAGGEAGFGSAFLVHGVLRRLKRTGYADYAIGGGVVALCYAGLLQTLGLGEPDHGWVIEIGLGGFAGMLYRLFAGVRPAD